MVIPTSDSGPALPNEHAGELETASQEDAPVMCCHPTEAGGVSTRLVRGSAPSTPNGHSRMSIKKFFRVSVEENKLILNNAANAGLEPSSYMRIQVLGKPTVRKVRRVRADWDELRKCMGVINKAGNVVNQYVKILYLSGQHSEIASTAFTELAAAARAIVSALKEL